MESILAKRVEAFGLLGNYMRTAMDDPEFRAVAGRAGRVNPLFTVSNIERAVRTWGDALRTDSLKAWLEPYLPQWQQERLEVALVMAGNIPIVGFQDYLCALLCGFRLQIKLSSKDPFLLPFLHSKLLELASGHKEVMEENGTGKNFPESGEIAPVIFTQSIVKDFDAVIATGSGNTFRYFDFYFGRYPHLLRRNRTSCALLDGTESREDLSGLADDALSYFGMGCRNVSKIYVPDSYDFTTLLETLHPLSSSLLSHAVYKDNYDYHKAVCMLNRQSFFDNGSVLLQPSTALASPMGVLYYETYQDKAEVEAMLEARRNEIQCVMGKGRTAFGTAQSPGLADYADGVDIMDFLLHLRSRH
ncbi:MAG: acyl-CoA reductase [Bacteroidetes bacterium]|uniref:Acyl-CoA reductase n=1 Tax=Candidatus Pullibacteroides excrementavium TaxID=2840905 RepID=A0A9D9DT93_9BACT|nr:acyl-CoA reductase [Candidatus Pullibacteroides excrementavium]